MNNQHEVKFVASGRGKARCAPNPDYPNGIAIKLDATGPTCIVQLPYPAPECGWFDVRCNLCGLTVAITCAGRTDDPISAEIPCSIVGNKANNLN